MRERKELMINMLFNGVPANIMALAGLVFAFIMTCLLLVKCNDRLPKDQGREFAVNGALSAGKPRGAGFIFILVLLAAAMMTGFLDDCSRAPWGELKKGLLDFAIAVMVAITFLNFNSNVVEFAIFGGSITIPPVIFGILTVVLVWVSINVTNCSDGVDGLSGTLTIITLISLYMVDQIKGMDPVFSHTILLFVICILAYLWFNATPSKLMMGDAGSRAMGFFISIAALKTGSPFIYIPVAIVLILDGGLGLLKVSLLRFLKIKILVNTRTPLHDHVRKVMGWSNTQAVFRFAIIQIMISAAVVYLIM